MRNSPSVPGDATGVLRLTREGKPVLVYDGNCAFCRGWVAHWERTTGDAVRYVPLINAAQSLSPEQCTACEQAIHLFLPGGSVYRGAHAVFRAWAVVGRRRWLLWCYEHLPGTAAVAEAAYRFISTRRMGLSHRAEKVSDAT